MGALTCWVERCKCLNSDLQPFLAKETWGIWKKREQTQPLSLWQLISPRQCLCDFYRVSRSQWFYLHTLQKQLGSRGTSNMKKENKYVARGTVDPVYWLFNVCYPTNCKFCHQLAPLALPYCFWLLYWPHQPKSHQSSLNNISQWHPRPSWVKKRKEGKTGEWFKWGPGEYNSFSGTLEDCKPFRRERSLQRHVFEN